MMDELKLLSYLNGELGEEEVLQVETWSGASEENQKLLEQIYYTTFVGERIAAMNSVDVEGSLKRLKAAIKPQEDAVKKQGAIGWKQYATPVAAFLTGIVFTIGFSYLAFNKTSSYIVATTAGQRAQFVLPDGSKVWLNASTQLAYKSSLFSRERQVDLTGEAYFEVARNEKAPFVVKSKNIKTEVLGTKFNVRARAAEEKVVTTLLKGAIRVDLPREKSDGFILRPGQILNVNTSTLQAELTESPSARDVLLWLRGTLSFEQATYLDIARCLEQHFDVHFYFKDEQLKKERFTCEFRTDNSIEDILAVLSLTKRFQYKIDENKIYIFAKK